MSLQPNISRTPKEVTTGLESSQKVVAVSADLNKIPGIFHTVRIVRARISSVAINRK